jgi:hypothetical protein
MDEAVILDIVKLPYFTSLWLMAGFYKCIIFNVLLMKLNYCLVSSRNV